MKCRAIINYFIFILSFITIFSYSATEISGKFADRTIAMKDLRIEVYPYYAHCTPILYDAIGLGAPNQQKEFSISVPWHSAYYFQVMYKGAPYHQQIIEHKDKTKILEPLLIQLAKTPKLKGVVLNEGNEPVSGAIVGPLYSAQIHHTSSPRYTLSQKDGSFAFYDLDFKKFGLQCTHPDYKGTSIEGIAQDQSKIKLYLKDGGTAIKGSMVGSRDFQPIQKGDLLLVGQDYEQFLKADQNGAFTFNHLPSGKYYIQPLHKGYYLGKPTVFELYNSPIEGLVVIRQQGIMISGKAVDPIKNNPILNLALTVQTITGEKEVYTDASGDFLFPEVIPKNLLQLEIKSNDFRFTDKDGRTSSKYLLEDFQPEEDIDNLVLHVEKKHRFIGSIKTNKRLSFPKVHIVELTRNRGSIHKSIYADMEQKFTYESYTDGVYGFWLEDVKAGLTSKLEIIDVSKAAINTHPIDLNAEKEQPRRIVIMNEYKEPLPGSKLKFFADKKHAIKLQEYDYEPLEQSIQKVTGLPVYPLYVEISHQDYSQTLQEFWEKYPRKGQLYNYTFAVKQLLEGTTSDENGQPLPEVNVLYPGPDGEMKIILSNQNGKYRITDLEQEKLKEITFKRGGYNEIQRFDIDLPSTLNVKMQKLTAYEGIIYTPNAQRFKGTIEFTIKNIPTGKTKKKKINVTNGSYELIGFSPGQSQLSIIDANKQYTHESWLYLEPETPNLPDIYLENLTGIYGTVYDENHNPLPLATVKMLVDRAMRENMTDGTGAYQFQAKLKGQAILRVSAEGYLDQAKTLDLSTVTLPYSIEMQASNHTINGKITGAIDIGNAEILFFSEEEINRSITGKITGDSFYISNIPFKKGVLILRNRQQTLAQQSISFGKQQTVQTTLRIDQLIKITGQLDMSYDQIPVFYRNTETNRMYRIKKTAQGKYQVQIPKGEYQIHIGEMPKGEPQEIPNSRIIDILTEE